MLIFRQMLNAEDIQSPHNRGLETRYLSEESDSELRAQKPPTELTIGEAR